jgi:hypothetical protein
MMEILYFVYSDGEYGMASLLTVNSVLRRDFGDILWDNKYFAVLGLISKGITRQPELFSACIGEKYTRGGLRDSNIFRNRINILRKRGYLETELRQSKAICVNFHRLTPRGQAVVNRIKQFLQAPAN